MPTALTLGDGCYSTCGCPHIPLTPSPPCLSLRPPPAPEVERSILGDGCIVEPDARILHSVVGLRSIIREVRCAAAIRAPPWPRSKLARSRLHYFW